MSNILGFNIDNIEDFKFLFLEFSIKVEFKVLEVVFLRRIAYCITIEKKFRKKTKILFYFVLLQQKNNRNFYKE